VPGIGARPRGTLLGLPEGRAFALIRVGATLRGAEVVDNAFDRRALRRSGVTLATSKG
jgi:hypothetical protein